MGEPDLVFLDEPSAGMDPAARRSMWEIIRGAQRTGQTVIICTHSMSECEALADRVGIMASGRLRCLGTCQHLKNRFGQAFQLDIRSHHDNIEEACSFVRSAFKGAELLEAHGCNLKFRVPSVASSTPRRGLADMFRIIELKREQVGIVEYALSQTTLDQIFMYFAHVDDEERLRRTTAS